MFAFLAMCIASTESRAWNDASYPDLKGQWHPIGDPTRFDASKGPGLAQQAPLDPRSIRRGSSASLKDRAAGGRDCSGQLRASHRACRGSRTATARWKSSSRRARRTSRSSISTTIVASIRMDALAGRNSSRPRSDIPSARGSIRTGTAGMTSWRSRRAVSGPRTFDDQRHSPARGQRDRRQGADLPRPVGPNVFHDEVTVIDHALTSPRS